MIVFFFFQAEDGIRDGHVTGVQTCALPILNIGRSEEITVLECAQLILAVTGSHSQIRFSEPLEDDPKRRCPDITKARKLLGWESKVNLPTGLRRTVDYFRTLLSVKLAKEPPIAS